MAKQKERVGVRHKHVVYSSVSLSAQKANGAKKDEERIIIIIVISGSKSTFKAKTASRCDLQQDSSQPISPEQLSPRRLLSKPAPVDALVKPCSRFPAASRLAPVGGGAEHCVAFRTLTRLLVALLIGTDISWRIGSMVSKDACDLKSLAISELFEESRNPRQPPNLLSLLSSHDIWSTVCAPRPSRRHVAMMATPVWPLYCGDWPQAFSLSRARCLARWPLLSLCGHLGNRLTFKVRACL